MSWIDLGPVRAGADLYIPGAIENEQGVGENANNGHQSKQPLYATVAAEAIMTPVVEGKSAEGCRGTRWGKNGM